MPILAFGTEAQKRRYLPGLCDGRLLGANAASEPEAGSDIFGMQTRAVRHGDGWVLNGRKTWITSGADRRPRASASPAPTPPRECSASRRSSSSARRRDFRWSARSTTWDCAPPRWLSWSSRTACSPPIACSAAKDEARRSSTPALEWERGAILAGIVGTMRRQLDRCVEQARTRKQFGQPIGKFQSVSNRIVDMTIRLETSRFMVYRYAWAKSQGEDAALWASMAKLHVSESFVQNSLDAVRLFGASGFAIGERARARSARQRRRRDLFRHE